ncbi:hypothetical protein Bca52824_060467 [Brassica carinata]|uniref:Uncharacterized protein n=1 Tax=Brassica carinata TaxID=52824 RepID=A0A8X7QXK7_BRACI|nr:hypothetical protein Bca52824_060467 [Brassica carinata]
MLLKVICILPPITNDPEADVCMEDEANKDLDDMADLSKRGYKFKIRDWRNMSVDLYGANEQIRRASLLFGNGGMSQASSSDRGVFGIKDQQNQRDDRKQIKERVTKLEKLQRVTSYETPNNEDTREPMNENTKETLDVESRVQNTFEIGANVEISSQDDNTCHKWYPENVLAIYLVDGVEMVKVEYSATASGRKEEEKC